MKEQEEQEQVRKAKELAEKFHSGQFRRDGVTPYIEHLKRVAELAPDDYYSQTAAWLHDILEDTSCTVEILEKEGIHKDIIHTVVALTRQPGEEYWEFILRIRNSGSTAKDIKIADIVANLTDDPTEKQILKYNKALRWLC